MYRLVQFSSFSGSVRQERVKMGKWLAARILVEGGAITRLQIVLTVKNLDQEGRGRVVAYGQRSSWQAQSAWRTVFLKKIVSLPGCGS